MNFLLSAHAVLPILLQILLGMLAKRFLRIPQELFRQLNRLCFRLFLPINLFYSIYNIGALRELNWRAAGYLFGAVFFCAAIGLAATRLVPERAQRGVIAQAAFRSNQAVLGLPLAAALGGEAAAGYAALLSALCVPLYNVLAVLVLSRFAEAKRPTARELFRRVCRNPLILGIMPAVLLVLLRQLLPEADGKPVVSLRYNLPSLYAAIKSLSAIASPAMLFALGGMLDFAPGRTDWPRLSLGVFLRLVFCPALVLGGAAALRGVLNLTPTEWCAILAAAGAPVAVSSAVMVQELGGDDRLAAQLVAWSSLLSMLTLFLAICLLRSCGLI